MIAAPVVATNQQSVNVVAGQTVTIDSGVTVSSSDTDVSGAVVTIDNNYQSGDELNFTPQNGISIASNADNVLTLTGNATPAQYQEALQSITFTTKSTSNLTRTVSFVVQDSGDTGGVNSNVATTTIVISANAQASDVLAANLFTAALGGFVNDSEADNYFEYDFPDGLVQIAALFTLAKMDAAPPSQPLPDFDEGVTNLLNEAVAQGQASSLYFALQQVFRFNSDAANGTTTSPVELDWLSFLDDYYFGTVPLPATFNGTTVKNAQITTDSTIWFTCAMVCWALNRSNRFPSR